MAGIHGGEIRTATSEDALAIARVHVASWRSAYQSLLPAAFLERLSERDRCTQWQDILTRRSTGRVVLVAEIENRVVGFLDAGSERNGDTNFDSELYSLYIIEEFQRQGLGSALFEESSRALASLGAKSIKVWVLKDSPHRLFYSKIGGTLLPGDQLVKIGDTELIAVAYAWRKMPVHAT